MAVCWGFPVIGVAGGAALWKLDVDFLVLREMASYGVRSGDS